MQLSIFGLPETTVSGAVIKEVAPLRDSLYMITLTNHKVKCFFPFFRIFLIFFARRRKFFPHGEKFCRPDALRGAPRPLFAGGFRPQNMPVYKDLPIYNKDLPIYNIVAENIAGKKSMTAAAGGAMPRAGRGSFPGRRIHGTCIIPFRLAAAIGTDNFVRIYFDELFELLSAFFALVL